jgi:hypothetical protein
MRVGRTLTHHFEIETRQYDLLGIDLGEGARRRMIIFGAVIVVLWGGLMALILGVPNKTTVSLYIVPPFVITAFGWRPGKYHERRRRVTEWALAVRYALRAHRPVIGLGARAADKSEYLPWSQRVRTHRVRVHAVPEWERLPVSASGTSGAPGTPGALAAESSCRAGADIMVNQRARLHGTDHLSRIRRRATKKRH